jgi:hypothetical protein
VSGVRQVGSIEDLVTRFEAEYNDAARIRHE